MAKWGLKQWIFVETIHKIGFHTMSLMNSTYSSTIWDKSSVSYARALAQYSVSADTVWTNTHLTSFLLILLWYLTLSSVGYFLRILWDTIWTNIHLPSFLLILLWYLTLSSVGVFFANFMRHHLKQPSSSFLSIHTVMIFNPFQRGVFLRILWDTIWTNTHLPSFLLILLWYLILSSVGYFLWIL